MTKKINFVDKLDHTEHTNIRCGFVMFLWWELRIFVHSQNIQ